MLRAASTRASRGSLKDTRVSFTRPASWSSRPTRAVSSFACSEIACSAALIQEMPPRVHQRERYGFEFRGREHHELRSRGPRHRLHEFERRLRVSRIVDADQDFHDHVPFGWVSAARGPGQRSSRTVRKHVHAPKRPNERPRARRGMLACRLDASLQLARSDALHRRFSGTPTSMRASCPSRASSEWLSPGSSRSPDRFETEPSCRVTSIQLSPRVSR